MATQMRKNGHQGKRRLERLLDILFFRVLNFSFMDFLKCILE